MSTENICIHCNGSFKTTKNLEIHTSKFHKNKINPDNTIIQSNLNIKNKKAAKNIKNTENINNIITKSMHNAFGPNFKCNNINENTITTVNGKNTNESIYKQIDNTFMNDFTNPQTTNNITTTINGKEVKIEDVPIDLQKIIQDSLKQTFGTNYIDPFQNINKKECNKLLKNYEFNSDDNNSNSDDDDDSSDDNNKKKDLKLQNKYDEFISDFLEIILMLEIISNDIKSDSLKNVADKCNELKMRLYNIVQTKKKEELDKVKIKHKDEQKVKKLVEINKINYKSNLSNKEFAKKRRDDKEIFKKKLEYETTTFEKDYKNPQIDNNQIDNKQQIDNNQQIDNKQQIDNQQINNNQQIDNQQIDNQQINKKIKSNKKINTNIKKDKKLNK
jgi:hypothetical protein